MEEAQSNEAQGTHSLREQDAKNEYDIMRQLAENCGPFAVFQHIKGSMNRWRKEQVKFAITGRSATGKSTFINTIRNLKPGDDGFAKAGSGNTTIIPTLYMYPYNDQIAFYDLPCYSTIKFKKEDYISEMKISDYDFFFIFFDNVLGEDDVWLVRELRKLGKLFSLVRSKIDADIESAKHNGKDRTMITSEIKREIQTALHASPELKDTKRNFLISSRTPDLGEMSTLLRYVKDNIGGRKAQALLFSLESVAKEIVERKTEMLRKRILTVSILNSGMARIAVTNNTSLLANEVHHYMSVFGINRTGVDSLRDFNQSLLRCRSLVEPNFNMENLVVTHMRGLARPPTDQSFSHTFLTITGYFISLFVTSCVAYLFLENMLKDISHDAVLIYEHVLKINAYH